MRVVQLHHGAALEDPRGRAHGRLGGLGVPVLYNLPLGHGASLATLPLGVQATVDADEQTLTIDEPALR